MSVPTRQEFAARWLVQANGWLLYYITEFGNAGCSVRLYSATDALIAILPLADPVGSVNGTTGALTLNIGGGGTASASGIVAYAAVCNNAGDWVLRLPVVKGGTPIRGLLVMNETTMIAGSIVALTTLEIQG